MKRMLAVLVLLALGVSCRSEEKTPPPPKLSRQDLVGAVLDNQSIGEGWEQQSDAAPNTVQIGGKVGVGNVRPVLAEATSAFKQKDGTGFVSNSVLLLHSAAAARSVVTAHRTAAAKTSWTQDRDDGGTSTFTRVGPVSSLPELGDEMYATKLKVQITGAEDQKPDEKTEYTIDYVVFSVGPLVAFVVTQQVSGSPLARRLESRVAQLLTKS